MRFRDVIFPELWLRVVPSTEGDLMSNEITNCLIDMKAFPPNVLNLNFNVYSLW